MPLKIGLTGGIGAGKSLVLDFLRTRGVPVLQADILGHQLLQDKNISKRLLGYFGSEILGKKGRIDRQKLGRIVFRDRRAQKKLNALMHPQIREKVADWFEGQVQKTKTPVLVVVEVPLLFEGGFYRWFDGTLCISAPSIIRRERLSRRGWSLSEIRRRERLQWSQTIKNQKADWVIFNQGTPKDLKYAVDQWLDDIKGFGKK